MAEFERRKLFSYERVARAGSLPPRRLRCRAVALQEAIINHGAGAALRDRHVRPELRPRVCSVIAAIAERQALPVPRPHVRPRRAVAAVRALGGVASLRVRVDADVRVGRRSRREGRHVGRQRRIQGWRRDAGRRRGWVRNLDAREQVGGCEAHVGRNRRADGGGRRGQVGLVAAQGGERGGELDGLERRPRGLKARACRGLGLGLGLGLRVKG